MDEILTIREVAALLKIGEKTAYTMVQSGQLPGFKVRGQWRFRRADIERWINTQLTDTTTTTATGEAQCTSANRSGDRLSKPKE
jgi:excisionase family DNA binding protein